MTIRTTGSEAVPDPEERAARNAALLAENVETGFWDDQGRPAPWPDDIDEWTPHTASRHLVVRDEDGPARTLLPGPA